MNVHFVEKIFLLLKEGVQENNPRVSPHLSIIKNANRIPQGLRLAFFYFCIKQANNKYGFLWLYIIILLQT